MELSVLKKLVEDLETLKKTLNDFIDNNIDKYEWNSIEFIDVLKSIGKKACGNDKTASFHINKVKNFTCWNDWVVNSNKEYYSQRLRIMFFSYKHLKGITDEDVNWISNELNKIKTEKRNKEFNITKENEITTNEDCNNIIETRLKGILDGSIKPTKFDLFGVLLPPRRAEIANIKCVIYHKEIDLNNEGEVNYYVQSTKSLMFDQYKTKGKYGTQIFELDKLEEHLPFLDPKVKDIVIKLIDDELFEYNKNLIRQDYNNGKEYSEGCFSGVYSLFNKFTINDARKYWASKVFKTGNLKWYKKLNYWLSHSVGVDINHYQKV